MIFLIGHDDVAWKYFVIKCAQTKLTMHLNGFVCDIVGIDGFMRIDHFFHLIFETH